MIILPRASVCFCKSIAKGTGDLHELKPQGVSLTHESFPSRIVSAHAFLLPFDELVEFQPLLL